MHEYLRNDHVGGRKISCLVHLSLAPLDEACSLDVHTVVKDRGLLWHCDGLHCPLEGLSCELIKPLQVTI